MSQRTTPRTGLLSGRAESVVGQERAAVVVAVLPFDRFVAVDVLMFGPEGRTPLALVYGPGAGPVPAVGRLGTVVFTRPDTGSTLGYGWKFVPMEMKEVPSPPGEAP